MNQSLDTAGAIADEDFADAVIDLYNRIRRDIPEEPGAKVPNDVKAVAFPLATLRGALDVLKDKLLEDPAPGKIKSSQIISALHLFDALLTGAEHPFWRYVRALKTSNRRPPSEAEIVRRAMAVGLLRALVQAGSLSVRLAAAKIEAECLKSCGMRISVSQLREWNTDFQATRADDPEPDRCAAKFRSKAGTDTNWILKKGVAQLDEFFGKPNR
jgi:hypothetical protein